MIIIVIILSLISVSPIMIFYQWIFVCIDKIGMKVQALKTNYSFSETELVGFFGAYECCSFNVYIAKFSINDQTFNEVISQEISKLREIKIQYVIGRSKKIYIKKIKPPTKVVFY